jgi:hypothetical protein
MRRCEHLTSKLLVIKSKEKLIFRVQEAHFAYKSKLSLEPLQMPTVTLVGPPPEGPLKARASVKNRDHLATFSTIWIMHL